MPSLSSAGRSPEDWSREEVEATVADYFAMLAAELAGIAVNKADRNRRLRLLLRNETHRDFFDPLLTGPVIQPVANPQADALNPAAIVDTPPEQMRVPAAAWSPTARLSRIDFVARDAANRDLGRRLAVRVVPFESQSVPRLRGWARSTLRTPGRP